MACVEYATMLAGWFRGESRVPRAAPRASTVTAERGNLTVPRERSL